MCRRIDYCSQVIYHYYHSYSCSLASFLSGLWLTVWCGCDVPTKASSKEVSTSEISWLKVSVGDVRLIL